MRKENARARFTIAQHHRILSRSAPKENVARACLTRPRHVTFTRDTRTNTHTRTRTRTLLYVPRGVDLSAPSDTVTSFGAFPKTRAVSVCVFKKRLTRLHSSLVSSILLKRLRYMTVHSEAKPTSYEIFSLRRQRRRVLPIFLGESYQTISTQDESFARTHLCALLRQMHFYDCKL